MVKRHPARDGCSGMVSDEYESPAPINTTGYVEDIDSLHEEARKFKELMKA